MTSDSYLNSWAERYRCGAAAPANLTDDKPRTARRSPPRTDRITATEGGVWRAVDEVRVSPRG